MTEKMTLPKETLADLLLFLAEEEQFEAVQTQLAGTVTVEEVKEGLQELAAKLKREIATEEETGYNVQKESRLSKQTKEVVSFLSPHEEKTILRAFGFIDKGNPLTRTSR